MNKKDKIYTEQFLMKLSKEQMDYLVYLFGKKKLSGKIREYLMESVRRDHKDKKLPLVDKTLSDYDEPVIEYSLKKKDVK